MLSYIEITFQRDGAEIIEDAFLTTHEKLTRLMELAEDLKNLCIECLDEEADVCKSCAPEPLCSGCQGGNLGLWCKDCIERRFKKCFCVIR